MYRRSLLPYSESRCKEQRQREREREIALNARQLLFVEISNGMSMRIMKCIKIN